MQQKEVYQRAAGFVRDDISGATFRLVPSSDRSWVNRTVILDDLTWYEEGRGVNRVALDVVSFRCLNGRRSVAEAVQLMLTPNICVNGVSDE